MTHQSGHPFCLSFFTTNTFGHPWITLTETASTIDYARDWRAQGAPHGAVVTAEVQTQGRGRQGRSWASPRGGLWMSIITYPKLPAENAGRLGLALAVAGAEACEEVADCRVGLKWPNDLLLGKRKVGGVLIESSLEQGLVTSAILSIGLNVNMRPEELPEEVRERATSLLEHLGQEFPLVKLAQTLLHRLEAYWPDLEGDGTPLQEAWAERDSLRGREVSVTSAGKQIQGVARGIDGLGRLDLLTPAGAMLLTTGEVTAVRERPG